MAPPNKVFHKVAVLALLSSPDTRHNSSVVGQLLHMADLRVVLKVRSVQGKEERGQPTPLWCSLAAGHGGGYAASHSDKLWSVREVVSDPVQLACGSSSHAKGGAGWY